MKIVVMIAAVLFGGFALVKCIMAIQKKQNKEAVIYGVGAFLAFLVAVFFFNGVFINTANNVSGSDVDAVLL